MWSRWMIAMFLVLGLAGPSPGESPTESPLVELRDVSVERQDRGFTVRLRTTGPVKSRHELIDTPYRVVIDLEGAAYAWQKTPLSVGADPLRQVRGSQYKKGVTRVVLELSRKAAYRVEEGPEGLTVTLEPALAAKARPANVTIATTHITRSTTV